MSTSKTGLARMPSIVAGAVGDIRHRLWTLYWLARMMERVNPTPVLVELGVRGGDSTRALLAAAEDLAVRLYSYDIEDCRRSVSHPNWRFRRMDSIAAAAMWCGTPVQMCLVDTDHTRERTRREIGAWSQWISLGGCLVFHDYWLYDPPRDADAGRGVKLAVDEWADAHVGSWELETHDAGPDGDTGLGILWRRQ